MSLTCRTCRRTNPPEAQYCYYDGVALDAAHARGPVAAGAQPFPTPFVLPSGKSCGSFDELVRSCDNDWDAAKSVLQLGYLEGFLGGLGRIDLAVAARQAAGSPDLDRGLDELLAKLPSSVREPAKLQVEAREIDLGELESGTDQRLTLTLKNAGMGLLQGTISCGETAWLAVGDAPAGPQKMFQCRQESVLPVHVVGKSLRANAMPLTGKLIVDSNGGVMEIPVRVRVPVKPFPSGVLAGAKTPRQVAEKAKASPKDAAVLFASGAVATWYESNGWTYPVKGPSATGLGAVQQFFEALGLVAAPKVTISTEKVQFRGAPGTHLEQVVQVQTVEKRPVYAHAVSTSAWLQIGKVQLKGQTAHIPLIIASVPSMPGEELQCRVEVAANGNQSFGVTVTLAIADGPVKAIRVAAVHAAPAAAAAAVPAIPVLPMAPPPLPARPVSPITKPSSVTAAPFDFGAVADVEPVPFPASSGRDPDAGSGGGLFLHLVPLLLLVLGLGGMLVHDYWLPAREDQTTTEETGPPPLPIDPDPYLQVQFHEGPIKGMPKEVAAMFKEPTMRFGLSMVRDPETGETRKNKKLTFNEWGISNNTIIKVGHEEFMFGGPATKTHPVRGFWVDRTGDKDEKGRKINGLVSSWRLDGPKILVTQRVEIVPSEAPPGSDKRRLDTCLVSYVIKNEEEEREHEVGLRFLLDTFIGERDGVPFTIPGRTELCNTKAEFPTPTEPVPDFIQVLEENDLRKPGTVARLQFKLGKKYEAPEVVRIGGWPNPAWKHLGFREANGQFTMWDVPWVSMEKRIIPDRTLPRTTHPVDADSAVTMYWEAKPLRAGATRTVGFAYGLGSVASKESGGKLLLTVGGRMVADTEFTLTALVQDPAKDEHLTLELPAGVERVDGSETEAVPGPAATAVRKVSTVTWKLRAKKAGEYTIVVKSSNGAKQTVKVRIGRRGVFD